MSLRNQFEIDRNKLCMHVTAVKIIGKYLFIAEGNQVSVFCLLSKQIILSEIIFSTSSIHGIRTDGGSRVLFFGSKSLKIYFCDSASLICLKQYTEEFFLCDWIFDVKWLTDPNKTCDDVAVISAHNCVTILNIDNITSTKTFQCAEKCIIYAANIISVVEYSLVVAVGTVFRQILIWSPNSSSESNANKKPLHCLEGHKGVIFSISYNHCHKLLSSTSDDRSIRLWKVNSVSDDDSSLIFWEKADIYPSHILYAHESRVWTSAILENCILSIGEDSFICFWSINGELLKRKKCHRGGSIWCLETNQSLDKCLQTDDYNTNIAITGGSDGGVYSWELRSILSKNLISQISLPTRPSSEKDFPRIVSIIACNEIKKLVAVTDQGWLMSYHMDKKIWKAVYHDASYASYNILSVSVKNIIALGNLNGDLILINYNDLSDENNFKKFKIYSGKIFALHWSSQTSEHLLSCGAEGFMILWKVSFLDKEYNIHKLFEFQLPKCKPHWWSTCALYSDTYLIVGDRGGSINFYSPDTKCDEILNPKKMYKCIHGENGVTDIQAHQSLIYSAGRDGRVLLYNIKDNSLNLLHAIKISHDLEWIGRILFYNSDLLLLGFHTKYFIVWSTVLESTVMTVECGGGHRSWDFHLKEDGQATFTAIKKKDIIFSSENLKFALKNSVIKAGLSGKEFCKTCYLFSWNSNSSEAVIAAGGEDNVLRIIGFSDSDTKLSQMVVLHNLSGHLSSIRALAKTNMVEKDACLLASVGGRAQMMLWKIKNGSNIECEQLDSYILSSFARKVKKTVKENQDIKVDPQTRLMDVNLNSIDMTNGENYIIALACSDSYFRVYNFEAIQKLLTLYYTVQPGDHCILKVISIKKFDALITNLFFITASTNGHLNFISHEDIKNLNLDQSTYSAIGESRNKPQFQVHLHQSGINAIDVKCISENVWLLCTGGDDNAVSAVLLKMHMPLTDWEIISKTQVHFAHSSQITGIKIFDCHTIISASIDQRINIWKWHFDGNSINIVLETSRMSSIPDIADLECWETESSWNAVVCGEGLESFSIKNVK